MATIQVRRYADGKTAFRVRVRRHGLCISRQFPNQQQAEDFAAASESDFEASRIGGTKLSTLIDKYKAQASENCAAQCPTYWRAKIGHLRAADVTPAIIRAHRDELARTPARSHNYKTTRLRSPTTVRKYFITIGAVFKYAIRELDLPLQNPGAKVSKPKAGPHRVRYLTADERKRLLAAAKKSDSKTLYA